MRKFESLNPKELPKHFKVEEHGEQPIVDMKETKGRIDISYIFPGFYISDHKRNIGGQVITFKQINIGGTGWITESGRPLLPSFGRYVQIPPGCIFSISVKQGKPVFFDNVLVYPSQSMLTDEKNEEDVFKDEFEFDEKFYEKTLVYPKEIVGKRGPLEVDGYSSLLLNVCPFQYFPSEQRLEGYGNITVTIALEAKKEAVTISPYDPATNKMAYGNFFVNPEPGIEERVFPGVKYSLPPVKPWGPEFIIIYHNPFHCAAEKLAMWKNMRGLRTEIVSINDIGNTVKKIKNYIRSRFFSRLGYVLLFGDVDHIVPEIIITPEIDDDDIVTDHYYATAKDPTGDKFELPWIAIGRIPVRTRYEAKQVVNQIIQYEKMPPDEKNYYDRMVFAAFFQDDGHGTAERAFTQTMEKIREEMLKIGFYIDRIYDTNSKGPKFYVDLEPVPVEVKNALMKGGATATTDLLAATSVGQLIIAYRGHGRVWGWVKPKFSRDELGKVSKKFPTIFYSVNCNSGWFDLQDGTESFAEMILRIDAGAPSLIACTRGLNTWLNNYLMKALFDAMWGNILLSFPANVRYPVRNNRLGDILNYGKTYLPLQVGEYEVVHYTTHDPLKPDVISTSSVKDNIEISHVIGDPTLEIWKEAPKSISISAILWKSQIYIKLSLCPADAVITIWDGDRLIKRTEPLSTILTISLRGISGPVLPVRKSIKVCFWAPGYRFVQVVPRSSPYME